MRETYSVELSDEDGWAVVGPNDYHEVIGKGAENMNKAFARARQLNDVNKERDEQLS